MSHETIREWNIKFAPYFREIIKKRERNPSPKWHLDEMAVKAGGEPFAMWRAVDSDGCELDVFLQNHRDKEAAIRFLTRLLGSYPEPRVIATDKLRGYVKPIKYFIPRTEHRSHKGLNNRVENAHQPTRRKEKGLIRFKSPQGVQRTVSLMGKVRNIFSLEVGQYSNPAISSKIGLQTSMHHLA